MSATPRHVAVYGEIDPNLVDGSSVWLQSICQVLASLDGVEVTLLLRRPLEPGRRFLLAELEASDGVDVVNAGRPGLLDPAEALDELENLDRNQGPFDVVLLRGQSVLTDAAARDCFDGRLWSYAMTGRGMSDETLRSLGRRSARLLCQTEAVAEELREIVPEADGRVLVVPPMIPDFDPPSQRNGTQTPLRLVYSGKLAPEYCWLETVEAFRVLREVVPSAELHVLGDKIHRPPDRPGFHEEAVCSLRETEGLRWHGAVPRAAIQAHLAECDVALSIRDPAVEAARELSTKVLEYGAAGLPVVLNRAPAYERLLGDGYPFFVDDPQSAADLLTGPALDPELRAAAAAAFHAASREFTFSRVAERLADYLWATSERRNRPTQSVVRATAAPAVPQLLITTPFGLGVKDLAWLNHRVVLTTSITAPSLLAQHDQNFYWALFTDPDLPPEVRGALEEALAPFEGRAFLCPWGRYQTRRVLSLTEKSGIVGSDEHVLTGRIDDDDAWSRQVVGMVRERTASWLRGRRETPGLGMTFEHGLEWLMYDMVDLDALQKGRRHEWAAAVRRYVVPFLGTSVFVLSTLRAGMTAVSAGHTRMGEILPGRGYNVDVVSTALPMWLYCRHKQAGSGIQKAKGENVPMTLSDLARQFGLDEARTASYLADADTHGYALVKRIKRLRPKFERELAEVSRQIDDLTTSDARRAELERKRHQLAEEIAQMSETVVGEPEKAPASNSSDGLLA